MPRPRAFVLLLVLAGSCAPRPGEAPAPPTPTPTPTPAASEPVTPTPTETPPPKQIEPEVTDTPKVDAGLPWPAGVPPLAGATVIKTARISANVGDSPEGATFVRAPGEVQAVALAWITSAKERGFRVLAERSLAHVHVASLIDAAGRRAHLLIQEDREGDTAGMFHFGKHPQVPLAGRCVEMALRERRFEVDRGAITHGGDYRRGINEQVVTSQLGHDFDGDGELDAIVPTTARATCPEDVTWTVYLARGACMHEVGTVGPGELLFWDGEAGRPGPRPIVMEHDQTALGNGGVNSTRVTTNYAFDAEKSRYVQQQRNSSRVICHHCAWGTCKPLP